MRRSAGSASARKRGSRARPLPQQVGPVLGLVAVRLEHYLRAPGMLRECKAAAATGCRV